MSLLEQIRNIGRPMEALEYLAHTVESALRLAGHKLDDEIELLSLATLEERLGLSSRAIAQALARHDAPLVVIGGKKFVRKPVWLNVLKSIEGK